MTTAQKIPRKANHRNDREVVHEVPTREAEEELVDSLKNKEDSGFETLVRSYGPQVMAIAKRYLRSEADAADCFQDTFIAVFESVENFQHQSSFRHWVRGITVNKCLMKLRKRQRGREDSIDHMLPIFDERGNRVEVASPSEMEGIGGLLEAEELRRVVRETIDKLPDDYRLVLLLRDIDGYSTSESAAILRVKINAVKTRLHRARSALKFMLEPLLEQLDDHADV